jgi:hypothetical protein
MDELTVFEFAPPIETFTGTAAPDVAPAGTCTLI